MEQQKKNSQTNKQTKQTKERSNKQTNKQTDRQTNEQTNKQNNPRFTVFPPQNCVEFLFLDLCLPRLPRPASASRLRVTPSLSSHTIFVIPSSHNFVTHHLCHTIFHTHLLSYHLSHTIFHTQLDHTHNLITHTHYPSHTSLSHTIFHTKLCHTPSFTHILVTHHLSHTSLHLPFGTFPWQAWHF